MRTNMRLSHAAVAAAADFCVALTAPVGAKVEGDTIVLGAAVSLTGKYATNGKNTQDGYALAVKRVNELGGVEVGGKSYKLKIIYYDDESTSARRAAGRTLDQPGWRPIHTRALQFRAHQGHRARHGEVSNSDGRGQRRGSQSV